MKSGMYENIMEQPQVAKKILEGYATLSTGLCREIKEKRKLFLIGTGASLNGALASVCAFAKYAGVVPTVLPASEVEYYTHLFDKDSTVILISQSGDSYETKMMCNIMEEKQLSFWGITNETESTLAKKATRVLLMQAGKEVSSATKTQMATTLLLYLVAAGDNEQAKTVLHKIPACLETTLTLAEKPGKRIVNKIAKTKAMYILGDNINGATARQGALMIKEKNRIMAEGMTASEFRHGAVEVVEKGMQFVYIAPAAANKRESQTHLSYLAKLGCQLFPVADSLFEGIDEENHIPIKNCGEDVFSHICATVPLQLIAHDCAQLQGLDVDGFRYLSKVVGTY